MTPATNTMGWIQSSDGNTIWNTLGAWSVTRSVLINNSSVTSNQILTTSHFLRRQFTTTTRNGRSLLRNGIDDRSSCNCSCREMKENKARKLFRNTEQSISIFLFVVGLCLRVQYPSTYRLRRRVLLTAPSRHPPEGRRHRWPQQTRYPGVVPARTSRYHQPGYPRIDED